MGMPNVSITFNEAAKSVQSRNNTGVVGLILRDTVPTTNPITILSAEDIPSTLSEANRKQIELALIGADKTPQKIVAYVIAVAATDYTAAFDYFDTCRIDYLAVPTCDTDAKTDSIKTWITRARADGQIVKAVLPNTAADNDGVINFATEKVYEGDTEYTTEKFCARIAGILASTPLTGSCTFTAIPELTGCTKLSRTDMDTAIDAGKLIVFWDGEKVKIARGVNSYQTTTASMGAQFKKIRIVQIMDVIQNDIRRLAEDSYLGKYSNSYDNKMLLLGAIGDYLNTLVAQGVINVQNIDIDVEANEQYLTDHGEDVTSMTDTEIRQAATGDKVYLLAKITIYDAIEEIILPITV